jgi:hypothetical protein
MLLSHVLPLRPVQKIHTMFSGFTPIVGASTAKPLRNMKLFLRRASW